MSQVLLESINAIRQNTLLILESQEYKEISNSYSPDVAISDIIIALDELQAEISEANRIIICKR